MSVHSIRKVVVIAFDGISAFHLSVPCLVFQDVFLGHNPWFQLEICGFPRKTVTSTSGFDISLNNDISVIDDADIVIVPSWPNELPEPPTDLLDKLRHAHNRGAQLVGLCLGAFVIAATGLLDGKRATTHWAFVKSVSQHFPNVEFDSQPLFVEEAQIITSAGTAAALDCCLHLVRKFCGSDIASQIARVMVTAQFRSGGQQQYIQTPIYSRPRTSKGIAHLIEIIKQRPNSIYPIEDVAQQCSMSRRTFTRHFRAAYGCSFGEWLLNQRLIHSQKMLETTPFSVAQIAELAGFSSESTYRKHFKRAFQVSPTKWRESVGENNRYDFE